MIQVKTWSKIDDVIDNFKDTEVFFEVVVNNKVIFDGETIYEILMYHYTDWSFLVRNETPETAFRRMYTTYVSEVGYNYYRAVDAMTREYNPINNYSMTESGIDGNKISDKTQTTKTDTVNGNKFSDEENTSTGQIENDNYVNAFNSDVNDAGTHSAKSITKNNDVKDVKHMTSTEEVATEDNNVRLYDYDTVGKTYTHNETDETNANNITLSYHKEDNNGNPQTVEMGSDFTNGTIHELTRAGNIGVTTNAQMIQGEIEMRKVSLINEFVQGFIREYCCYLGVEE